MLKLIWEFDQQHNYGISNGSKGICTLGLIYLGILRWDVERKYSKADRFKECLDILAKNSISSCDL